MKAFPFMKSPCVYIEIGKSSIKVLDGDNGLELSLERLENGRLTPFCGERLTHSLRVFLKKHSWRPRLRAFCAIGARGVSLRRITLPSTSKEELGRLLLFQIEREFPLPPDELAWGYCQLNDEHRQGYGAKEGRELLVVAVKREVLQEYSEILAGSGLSPVFTLGALARSALCFQPPGSYAVLDMGRSHSELISFENGAPRSIRILPWGGENITEAIEKRLRIAHHEAEKLKIHWERESVSNGELGQTIQADIGAELESLARSIQTNWSGPKLYLTGGSARLKDIAPQLAKALGGGVECERMEITPGEGRSAAILGLKASNEKNGDSPPLVLRARGTRAGESTAAPAPWKWAALAGLLAAGCIVFPYAEALLMKPRLARKLAGMKADMGRLAMIDRELNFLQYLKENQPPYQDALIVLANAAPPGARIESLSMNRRGEVSLRGSMQDSQQVTDFRSKLIASGFFATVSVDEQTPGAGPDRQKVTVRITAQWKPAEARRSLAFDTPAKEPEKSKYTRADGTSGTVPPMQAPAQTEPPTSVDIPPSPPPGTASPRKAINE